MIYLDYAANTPADEAVLHALCETERSFPGNPNSAHIAGREAKARMDEATTSIAKMLSVQPEEIIYTSGASESNNTAIKGIARATRHAGRHIISTPLEHPSVSGCLTALQEQGYEIDLVDIGRDGKIDLEHLRELLRRDTVLCAVTAVDSELGTVQPVREIREILKDYPNCRFHMDATQAISKTTFDFSCADTVSFAPHKFFGLNGSGVLVKKHDLILEPLIHGGAGTTLYRSGTPTLGLAVSTETSLRLCTENFETRLAHVQKLNHKLREFFYAYLKVHINSPEDAVPHILNLSVQGVRGAAFRDALSENGVCVSVKSACSVENTPSRAVYAVSRDRKNALNSWRISLSHLTTEDELNKFEKIFDKLYLEFT